MAFGCKKLISARILHGVLVSLLHSYTEGLWNYNTRPAHKRPLEGIVPAEGLCGLCPLRSSLSVSEGQIHCPHRTAEGSLKGHSAEVCCDVLCGVGMKR